VQGLGFRLQGVGFMVGGCRQLDAATGLRRETICSKPSNIKPISHNLKALSLNDQTLNPEFMHPEPCTLYPALTRFRVTLYPKP
jgi:hypothetical protein